LFATLKSPEKEKASFVENINIPAFSPGGDIALTFPLFFPAME
jgi:hypothetical protein